MSRSGNQVSEYISTTFLGEWVCTRSALYISALLLFSEAHNLSFNIAVCYTGVHSLLWNWFEISCHLLKVYALVVSQTNRMRWRSPLLHSGSKKNQCLTSVVSRSLHIARASLVQPCPASGSKPSRRTHWPGYRHNACILTQNFPNTQSSTINTSYWYEKVSLSNGFDDLTYSVFTGAEWLKQVGP